MKITYYTQKRYGNTDRVPVSEDAIMVTKLTGRLTLSERDLQILSDCGHTIERVMGPE